MNVSNTYNQVFVGSRIDGVKTHFHQNKLVPDENVLYPTAGLSKSFVLSSSLFILAPVCSLYSELLREVWSLRSLVWLPAGVQIPISANCLRTCKDSTDRFVSTRSDSKKGRKNIFSRLLVTVCETGKHHTAVFHDTMTDCKCVHQAAWWVFASQNFDETSRTSSLTVIHEGKFNRRLHVNMWGVYVTLSLQMTLLHSTSHHQRRLWCWTMHHCC